MLEEEEKEEDGRERGGQRIGDSGCRTTQIEVKMSLCRAVQAVPG